MPVRRPPHRALVRGLLVLALLATIAGMLATWADRQLLSTGGWTTTSGRLIADRRVEPAVARYLVGQLFASTDVTGVVRRVLPGPVASLAAPLADDLRRAADRLAARLLATPASRAAWRSANREAQVEFLRILAGRSDLATQRGGLIVLDLHRLLTRLAAQVATGTHLSAAGGLGDALLAGVEHAAARQLIAALAPSAGHLVIMRSRQRAALQAGVQAIRIAAVALPVAVVVLLGLAVWLAWGRRLAVVTRAAIGAVAIGGLTLLVRRLLADAVASQLVTVDWARSAGSAAWLIGTGVLRDLALALLGAGAGGLVLAAVLGSGRRLTGGALSGGRRGARRTSAPRT